MSKENKTIEGKDLVKKGLRMKKLSTKWRREPICPNCHSLLTSIEEVAKATECPICGQPISGRSRTITEYLILS